MISTLVFDFSNVILFVRDSNYLGKLNDLHSQLKQQQHYNALEYFRLDTELLELLKSLPKNIALHLFTEGSMHLVPELNDELRKAFTTLNSAKDIGFGKKDPQVYVALSQKLNFNPSETLFIDDKQENIDAAKRAGLEAVRYNSLSELRDTLRTYAILK